MLQFTLLLVLMLNSQNYNSVGATKLAFPLHNSVLLWLIWVLWVAMWVLMDLSCFSVYCRCRSD